MANQIDYELLRVGGNTTVGPTNSIVQGGVRCAIFYLDPTATAPVRWVSSPLETKAPTRARGAPIEPGGHVVVAGEGTIRNSLFIATSDAFQKLHAYYYDQVDVIAFSGKPTPTPTLGLGRIEDLLEELLAEAKRRNRLLEVIADEEVSILEVA